MNQKLRNILAEIISALFIILFAYAALSKILDFEKFQVELGKSPILSAFSSILAFFVPGFELLVALLLILKRCQYWALYVSFGLMIVFSAYIIIILNFSYYIPCTCGGVLENMTWDQHLVFNIGFAVLGAMGVLIYPQNVKNLSAVRGKAFVPENGDN